MNIEHLYGEPSFRVFAPRAFVMLDMLAMSMFLLT